MDLPITVAGEDLAVSATTYVAFRQCPASAVARLSGIYGLETKASFKGSLAHRIFARHLEHGPIDATDVDHACREEIGKALNQKMASLGLKPLELRLVLREVAALYETFRQMPVDGFRASEVYIDADAGSGVTLRGRIDAIFDGDNGGVRLIDWKTGQLGDVDDQLAFYALTWFADTGSLPATIEALSVQTGERIERVPTEDTLHATTVEVGSLVDTVRRLFVSGEGGERRGGQWCRWCPLLEDCSEGQTATSVYRSG